ncbi:MAG TPA: condensation domain-containing protein, partial [Puia sp.]|nr:condensation domain-containing protein [Puia sp.]
DRKALPAPEAASDANYIGPSGEIEERLTDIWADVLKTDRSLIGANSDFFKLGGHSLNAIMLVRRVEKFFGRSIPLRVFYHLSTVREMARFLHTFSGDEDRTIPAAGEKEYYTLSSQQKRLFFLHELDRYSLAYNESAEYGLEGPLDTERLSLVFQRLVDRHEILRTSFGLVDGTPVQKVAAAAKLPIEWLPEGRPSEETLRKFIRPFDLSEPVQLRVGLMRLAPERHLLIVDLHHIITDGISKGVLINDFIAIYQDEPLPPPALHYKDFAEWQQGPGQRRLSAVQREFWLEQFSGEIPVLELPADFPRPPVKDYAGGRFMFALGREDTAALKSLALGERVTLYSVILALYNVLLARLSNQDDIVVGTPVAGRPHADLERVMGMFIDTIPVRNHPAENTGFRQFLQDLHSRTTACLDNQAYPYEQLVEELKVPRNTGRNPLFDALFIFHNFEMFLLEMRGLVIRRMERSHPISKFDLTLEAVESPEGLSCTFEYSTNLFRRDTVERFAGYFQRIVAAVTEDPEVKLGAI